MLFKNIALGIVIGILLLVIVGSAAIIVGSFEPPTPPPTPCGRTLFGVGVLEFKIERFGSDCQPTADTTPTPTNTPAPTSSPVPANTLVPATPQPQTVINAGDCIIVIVGSNAASGGNTVGCNKSITTAPTTVPTATPTATPTNAIKAPRPTITPTPTATICTPTPVCDCGIR